MNSDQPGIVESSPPPLFGDVTFAVINPPQLPDDDPGFTELLNCLEDGGATRVHLDAHGCIPDLKSVSHIISKTADFKDYDEAIGLFVHVVKPLWIHVSLLKRRQPNPRQYSPDPALFLSGITLSCADIPDGDAEAIAGGVLAMGGLISEQINKLVTHLVALSADDPKVQATLKKHPTCKVVIPHWFDDCLRLRRRISEEPYMLPDPEYLKQDHGPPKARNSRDIDTAMTATPDTPPTTKRSTHTVFRGRKILLGSDIEMSNRTRSTIQGIVENGGGEICERVEDCNIYIGQYRDGADYVAACKNPDVKEVGSLSWLYHLIIHDKWTKPGLRLLHYPVPRHGIPGFQNHMISLSNYTGHARIYLESLIKSSGAKFTKTMIQQNSHLITAHRASEKCDAAQEWGINIVNHLWLEESYALFKEQPLTTNRYTHFPRGTNLGEVVGQTPINRPVLRQFWASSEEEETEGEEMEDVSNGSVVRKTSSESEGSRRKSETSARNGANKANGRRAASDAFATPALRKLAIGKENYFPDGSLSTGSRASKSRALSKLHDQAADIQLFNKEMKRVGGVIHGRDRNSSRGSTDAVPTSSSRKGRKRSSDVAGLTDDSDAEVDGNGPTAKKTKTQKAKPQQKLRVLLSGYEKWKAKPNAEAQDKNKLRNLGIQLIEDPTTSNFILCAPRLLRTRKFVCAMAYGPDVVSTEFIDYILENKEIPEVKNFALDDPEGESKMGVSIEQSLQRAKKNKRKLLEGYQVFCTNQITGGFVTYKEITEANGGVCLLFQAKTVMSVPKNKLSGEGEEEFEDELFLLSGVSAEERKLWPKFEEMAKKAEMKARIVRSEWLLSLAMSQKIEWDEAWLHKV